ncbi:hypothetical protein EJK55_1236 [Moraxella catarrhalis]|uniref:Uncharacterized protein n=1 Tax=Moraxella catarrhalis TaxID=480 RepID=A0A3Q9GDJ0_MORCA|nr:hypothetical protein MCR_1112 [Moraxella catarrhalis BBH18]AZQ87723.1 hypothetical protein EJK52_1166 [Moraxella catarrhalis]EKF83718.1 hypothetical protein MCRH_1189 [Moraxella catarrhalis RH4]AZQ91042.1 hypothetical protein EJK51_1164 [Moraxella catarrhalis]AZQ93110.1 hypothetical protein EJK53_1241 [Moraxella catarrhalis]
MTTLFRQKFVKCLIILYNDTGLNHQNPLNCHFDITNS